MGLQAGFFLGSGELASSFLQGGSPVGIAGSLEGCMYREEGKTLSVAAGWPEPLP